MLTALRSRLVFDVDTVTPVSVERNDESVTVCFYLIMTVIYIIASFILSLLHFITQLSNGIYHMCL